MKQAIAAVPAVAASGASFAPAIACFANFVPNYVQYQASPFAMRLMEGLSCNQSQYSPLFTAPMIPAIFLSVAGGLRARAAVRPRVSKRSDLARFWWLTHPEGRLHHFSGRN